MTPGAAPPQPLPRIDALADAALQDGVDFSGISVPVY